MPYLFENGVIADYKHDKLAQRPVLLRALLWAMIFVLACALVVAQTTPGKKKQANPPPDNAAPAAAAPAPAASAPAPPPPPDPLGRGTPRGCVLGFLREAENQDYATAAKYLDSKKTDAEKQELAKQLKTLLDRGTTSDLQTLFRLPESDLSENVRQTRERVGVVSTPAGPLDVLVDRVERPNEQPIWLFSQETLRHVPAAYASLETVEQPLDLSKYFPKWMASSSLLGLPLWRWALFLVGLAVVLLLASLLTHSALWLVRRALHNRMTPATEAAVLKLKAPTFVLIAAIVERTGGGYSLSALSRHRWAELAALTALIGAAWLLIRLADIAESFAHHRFLVQMRIERLTFVGLLARMFKIFVVAILGILLLTQLGVNVSALVTGLGIGGIAIAFAAQKTLADLFGGVSIVTRGAVRVGDFCTISGKTGTVEEIGISSLRMRTLDRTVVSIPNSKVAEAELENYTMRDQYWVHQVFTLRFDTPYSVIQRVVKGMGEILKTHSNIDPTSARATLLQLTNAGPQVEVFAYYRKPGADWSAFVTAQEPIILQMMRLVEEEGTAIVAGTGFVQMPGMQATRPEFQFEPAPTPAIRSGGSQEWAPPV
jgi:MscS family membrane protein